MGATQCLNPTDYDKPIQKVLAGDITKWGIDFTFDCTGNTTVMRSALECAHRGNHTANSLKRAPGMHV